jgi:hypothetical protein
MGDACTGRGEDFHIAVANCPCVRPHKAGAEHTQAMVSLDLGVSIPADRLHIISLARGKMAVNDGVVAFSRVTNLDAQFIAHRGSSPQTKSHAYAALSRTVKFLMQTHVVLRHTLSSHLLDTLDRSCGVEGIGDSARQYKAYATVLGSASH